MKAAGQARRMFENERRICMKDTNLLTANLGSKIAVHSHEGSSFQLQCINGNEDAAAAEKLCNRVLNCRISSGQRYISFFGGTAMNVIVEEGNRANNRRNYVLQVFHSEPSSQYTGSQKKAAQKYASVLMQILADPSVSSREKALCLKPSETDIFTKLLPVIAEEMDPYITQLDTPVRLEQTEDISSRPSYLEPEQTYLFTALLSRFKSLSVKNYNHCLSLCTKASPISFQSLVSDYDISEIEEIRQVVFTDGYSLCKPLKKAVDIAAYLSGITDQLNFRYHVFSHDELTFLYDYMYQNMYGDPESFLRAQKAASMLRGQKIPEEYRNLIGTTLPKTFSDVKTRILIAWINESEDLFSKFMDMIWDAEVNNRKYIFVKIKEELSNPLWEFLTDELNLLNDVCSGHRKLSCLSDDEKYFLTMLCIDDVRLPGIRLSLRFRGRKQREDAVWFIKYVLKHDNPNHRESHLLFCPAYRTAFRSYIRDKRSFFRKALREDLLALIGTYL